MTTSSKTDAPVFKNQLHFLEEFPKTGADTLAGKMLRHYWHPVCLSTDLRDVPYPVRMLGEDLVAFRGQDGQVGLVDQRCAHRCASLVYGQITKDGLKCSYHGWTFDNKGRCTAMPLEPINSPAMQRVKQVWYPVQEWAGIVWTYMGEEKNNPPPLPKIDILSRTDGEIVMERGDIRPYNYLNFIENFADMGHIYVMHMLEPGKVPPELEPYVNQSVDTNWRNIEHRTFETDFGMKCVLVHNTADKNLKYVNSWSIMLPAVYRFGGIHAGLPPDFTNDRRESGGILRIIDDTHFEMFRFQLIRPGNFRTTYYPVPTDKTRGVAKGLQGTVEKKDYDKRKYPAWEGLPQVEDYVLQESQGEMAPRHLELLATSDIGIALLRRLWRRGMEAVAQGNKPNIPQIDEQGIVHVDTFKGLAHPDEIKLSPENMPSSEQGRGLIRDEHGQLVFGNS